MKSDESCSECGVDFTVAWHDDGGDPIYCPFCGADLDDQEDDEDEPE